jgi:hypothetical protein
MAFVPIVSTPTDVGLLGIIPIILQHSGYSPFSSTLATVFAEDAAKAWAEKKTYAEKLEAAEGDDIFKYILLINVSALEGYVAQTRIQAEQSFRLAKIVASIGFVILCVGISFSIYQGVYGNTSLEAGYLASVAGVLTEFISGVFFYLYNRTLQQINRFHDRLLAMEQTSMAYLATGLVTDRNIGDDARLDLAKKAAASSVVDAKNS